jgi:hypothetical protein
MGLFDEEAVLTYALPIPFTRELWHGRMMTVRGVSASNLSQAQIAAFEQEHWQFVTALPERFEIPHWVTILNLKKISVRTEQ